MKKRESTKLRLSKETLRTLEDRPGLEKVVGGSWFCFTGGGWGSCECTAGSCQLCVEN